MPKTARPEEAFQRALEGDPASSNAEPLVKLAEALRPAGRPGARPEFRAALRAQLMATATAAQSSSEEAFSIALDAPAEAPAELRALVLVAAALEPETRPAPSAAFRFQLRNQLMAQAARGSTLERARARVTAVNLRMRRSLRAVVATGLSASLLASGGMALAGAHNALPGDALYGLKRFQESAQLFTSSGTGKGFKYLGFARVRLHEVHGLSDRADPNQNRYVSTLGDMDSETVQGTTIILDEVKAKQAPLALLDQVNSFAISQAADLAQIVDRLPAGAQPAARNSLTLVQRVSTQLTNALNGCAPCTKATPGLGSTTTPGTSGTGAVTCSCTQPPSTGGSGGSDGSGTTGNGGGTPNPQPTTTPTNPPQPGPIPPTVPGSDQLNDLLDNLSVPPAPLPTGTTVPLPSGLPSVDPTTLPTGILPTSLPTSVISTPALPHL